MCCHGHVSQRPPNAACCGTQAYNQNLRVSFSKKSRLHLCRFSFCVYQRLKNKCRLWGKGWGSSSASFSTLRLRGSILGLLCVLYSLTPFSCSKCYHHFKTCALIINITISSIVIGLKKLVFFTNIHLPSCYRTVCMLLNSLLLKSLLSDSSISQSHLKL